MSRVDTTEDWILEDLAAITGKDIKELKRNYKSKTKSTPVNRHKYFRRPGKRHNNDFCFSCQEGGTLICCDGCTKSFHLLCLDPPMEDEDIPEGEWLCKTCKINAKNDSDNDCKVVTNPRKRKLSFEFEDTDCCEEIKLIRSVWSQLIKKAVESDPKEYENPLDCRTIPYIFPGDSKNNKKNSMKLKNPHLTQCYICSKGLSKQSMVSCDYCDRSFHLDCTDPPLTVPPKHFWMCQFHIEPCLERIFYQDEIPSLSQRIALWDMCRKPIDHETVKLEFLRNTVRDRSKMVQLPTVPIEIPDAVYNAYNNRPDMIPSLKEALRLVGYEQSVNYLQQFPMKRIQINREYQNNQSTSKEEQELWLSSILDFQKEMISKMNNEMKIEFIKNKENNLFKAKEEVKIVKTVDESEKKEENTNQSETASNSSQSSSSTCNQKNIKIVKPHEEITKILIAAVAELPEADECLNIMNYIDEEVINVLAFQRLCQLSNHNKTRSMMLDERDRYSTKLTPRDVGTKNLTNPELKDYVSNELEKVVGNESTPKLENAVDDTVTMSGGEVFFKINKDNLKSMLEDDVMSEDKSPDDNRLEEYVKIEQVKSEAPSNRFSISSEAQPRSIFDVKSEDDDEEGLDDDVTTAEKINENSNEFNPIENSRDSVDISKSTIINIDDSVESDDVKIIKVENIVDENVQVVKIDSIDDNDFMKNTIKDEEMARVEIMEFPRQFPEEVKILAVLTGIDKLTRLFPIYKSGFVIGTGNFVNLDLKDCGKCNFVSKQHAVLYFDRRSHLWEAINYSRYGCRVNNVTINFDVTKKSLHNILNSDSEDEEQCDFHESVRSISNGQSESLDVGMFSDEKELVVQRFNRNPCDCDPKEMMNNISTNGWNNSIAFGHGSLLQFGCIRLLFGDTSFVTS